MALRHDNKFKVQHFGSVSSIDVCVCVENALKYIRAHLFNIIIREL